MQDDCLRCKVPLYVISPTKVLIISKNHASVSGIVLLRQSFRLLHNYYTNGE